ncbi:MAG: YidC/Oxa1 family membrane protein insertase [Candidatus Peribacteraceae bacterium]|nr:YidC/Oxa1 family membrane protein insertase [Candidatus Peribacteraceae bacterium]
MAQENKALSLVRFALIFLIIYMGTNLLMRYFLPQETPGENGQSVVTMRAVDATVKGDHHPVIAVRNESGQDITLPDTCPMPPFQVWKVEGEQRIPLTAVETVQPCEPLTLIPAGAHIQYSLAPWKYSLFNERATYALSLALPGSGEELTAQFQIYEPGSITHVFRTFITKPMLNLLILIASLTPGYNLGVAIIILTIIVKLILFIPTQHALEGQKKLQLIQPKIEEIRRKYKEDPQRMNQETLKLWKQEKINPFQSCLPILLQFPFLIGLFYVIQDGAALELSRHLLYAPYQNLTWQFGTNFLGFDLTRPSVYIFPPLLVILQFLQMKLSFAIANRKKKNGKKDVIDVTPKKEKKPEDALQSQQMQQKVMMYGLPFMIGFSAIKFPAAVSLYWGISTLFAIGQQLVVNREHLKV